MQSSTMSLCNGKMPIGLDDSRPIVLHRRFVSFLFVSLLIESFSQVHGAKISKDKIQEFNKLSKSEFPKDCGKMSSEIFDFDLNALTFHMLDHIYEFKNNTFDLGPSLLSFIPIPLLKDYRSQVSRWSTFKPEKKDVDYYNDRYKMLKKCSSPYLSEARSFKNALKERYRSKGIATVASEETTKQVIKKEKFVNFIVIFF